MTEPNLLVICVAAFVAVMTILATLAGLIRVLMAVFPHVAPTSPDSPAPDGAVLAAIHTAAASAFPGTRVTRIEEHA